MGGDIRDFQEKQMLDLILRKIIRNMEFKVIHNITI